MYMCSITGIHLDTRKINLFTYLLIKSQPKANMKSKKHTNPHSDMAAFNRQKYIKSSWPI